MHKFRLFRFRSPLLAESQLIYFPYPTELIQFRWCPLYYYSSPHPNYNFYNSYKFYNHGANRIYNTVFIFRIKGFLHSETAGSYGVWLLPDEYRYHMRPSSANMP